MHLSSSNAAVKLVSNGYEVPPPLNGNQEAELQVMQLAPPISSVGMLNKVVFSLVT